MALNIDNESNSRRPLGFGLIGAVLIMFSGYLFYELEQQKSGDVYVPSSYEYTVRQSVDTNVVYLDSSYFENNRPGDNNTAYVKDLTKRITAKFNYNFSANDTADLSYSYDVKAKILGKYAIKADSDNTANVWSKEYTIVKPVSESLQTKNLTLNPTADLPFQEYMSQLENFKSNLELPLNSETLLVATIDVEGTIKGTPFHDTRVMTISAPLDQQIYTLGIKYDKQDTKKLVGETAKNSREQFQRYLLIFASAVGVLGIGMLLYGLRKQIFKTPYQRELERIYRYNDGIIIRSQKPTDISGKRLVAVASFEDMLNIEEELKIPIVASPAGPEATQFIVIRDDVAYVYTLGRLLVDDSNFDEIGQEIDTSAKSKKHRH